MTKSVTIRGTTYASMTEAASALGVSKATVSAARRRGTLDKVGLGTNQPGCAPVFLRETMIAGETFPSRKAAAAALGVSQTTLSAYFTVIDAIERRYAARITKENMT